MDNNVMQSTFCNTSLLAAKQTAIPRYTLCNFMTNVKLLYLFLIWFIAKNVHKRRDFNERIKYNLYLTNCPAKSHFRLTRLGRAMLGCCYWSLLINFLLIAVVNPGILNPGPNKLTIAYQNCRGLIPFKSLGDEHPLLDSTKIYELTRFTENKKPDILILNETWLSKSLKNNEIVSTDEYKVFRLDRSTSTHPPDPNNPDKYKRNAGGVMICVRMDLDIVTSRIHVKCAAEILGINIKFSDGKRLSLCTFYRTKTCGLRNHDNIQKYLSSIRGRGSNEMLLIGDINMPDTDWEALSSTNNVEQQLVNTFSDLGLTQLIDEPTHIHGNTLDYVLTSNPSNISNIKVDSNSLVCESDHFQISFDIMSKVKHKKLPKREISNLKRADWESLNNDFNQENWYNLLLQNNDSEHAYGIFKRTVSTHCNTRIPKIKVKQGYQNPWFDSETHDACRNKDRLRAKYKQNRTTENYVKFSDARRSYGKLCDQKMLENLFGDEEDHSYISKKFWSFSKSKGNAGRIPEVVHYNDSFKSTPADKAELFNEYFCNQFSEPSSYDINIDSSRDINFGLNISVEKVRRLLQNLNVNKAQGPDGIHPKILKNCADSLAYPLYLLFNMSYNTGIIPCEWKAANVVPVHKKNSKSDVSNYRPISLTCIYDIKL